MRGKESGDGRIHEVSSRRLEFIFTVQDFKRYSIIFAINILFKSVQISMPSLKLFPSIYPHHGRANRLFKTEGYSS